MSTGSSNDYTPVETNRTEVEVMRVLLAVWDEADSCADLIGQLRGDYDDPGEPTHWESYAMAAGIRMLRDELATIRARDPQPQEARG